jgi:hypothetical protein
VDKHKESRLAAAAEQEIRPVMRIYSPRTMAP